MKIICIEYRNYANHIEELQIGAYRQLFFIWNDSAFIKTVTYFGLNFRKIFITKSSIVKINKVGKYIEPYAHKYYEEIGVGIDFTARDLQTKLSRGYLGKKPNHLMVRL
jgi:2-keto-4-pentenoate hydratase/2-oxohepta-3-ene-1,7-dioic acid hydratase in catechol pathway